MVEIDTTQIDEEIEGGNKVIMYIAAFTTAWVRLELYSYLETLQEQVLYFDTDSIIHKWKPGQPEVETGPFLE